MRPVVHIEAINLTARLVLLEGGVCLPITNFFDCDGVECEPDEAMQAVAGEGDTWISFDPHDNYEPLALH